MINRNAAAVIRLALIVILLPGCAYHRPTDSRSAAEVFFDVAVDLIDIVVPDESFDESQLKKRRKWQCENLSAAELSKLGISEQCEQCERK